ncbi:MAG: VCBS domain-containing protein [Burkholderiaceae bacterium]
MATNSTSFTNTPQAGDDIFTSAMTGLTEDWLKTVILDVMSNDLGGKAKVLWSLDDGISDSTATKIYAPADLLTQDFARTETLSSDTSLNGAKIWITDDGKVGYSATALSTTFKAQLQALAEGQTLTDSFTYAIRLGNGTLSWATAYVEYIGKNDGPVLNDTTDPGAVVELGNASAQDLAAITGGFLVTDLDIGNTLTASVVGSPVVKLDGVAFSLPAGAAALIASGAFSLTNASQTSTGGALSVNYKYDPSAANLDFLRAGQSLTVTYAVKVNDGMADSATRNITFTITGTNDVPVISGETTGDRAVKEESDLSASGTLTIVDTDTGESFFTPASGSTSHGSYTLGANGVWTYSLSNGDTAVQALPEGATITDSFTAWSQDGSASKVVTITITGTNDVPVIGGVNTSTVKEDTAVNGSGNLTTSGSLTISDADQGQSNFTAQASAAGTYGTFTLASNGAWTYTANNSQSAIQQLGATQSITDSFTAVSSDGSASQLVTVTINGTNDVAVIGGTSTGVVTEDTAVVGGNLVTNGALSISDADAGQSSFVLQSATTGSNGYGTFTLATNGNWTYSANNSLAAIQALNNDQSLTDSFTALSFDGSKSQLVTVTINGKDEPATNTAPVNTLPATPLAVAAPKVAVTGLSVSDADAGTGILTTTLSVLNGKLSAAVVSGGATISNNGTSSITLNGTLAQINATLAGSNLTYAAVAGTNGYISTDTLTMVTNDNGNTGGPALTDTDTRAINVNATAISDTGSNNNTYAFNASTDAGLKSISDSGGSNDTIDIGAPTNLALTNLNFEQVGRNLVIDVNAMQITVLNQYADAVTGGTTTSTIENIKFANGQTYFGYALEGSYELITTLDASGSGNKNFVLAGGAGGDVVIGGDNSSKKDLIFGNASGDTLKGGTGNDLLVGGSGNDRLSGGAGIDTLVGGAGSDTFVFSDKVNADTIVDFNASGSPTDGDFLELSLAYFTQLAGSVGSALSASQFIAVTSGAAAVNLGALSGNIRVIYESSTGNMYYDTDGGTSTGRDLVATVTLTNPTDTFDWNDIRIGS